MTTATEFDSLPPEWEVVRLGDKFRFTSKRPDIHKRPTKEVAFLPMEMIPTGQLYLTDYLPKSVDEIASGIYFEEGDLLVAKITPCFENGKQGIARNTPGGFGIATTEVLPIRASDGTGYLPFLAMYLLDEEVRTRLAGMMEGATGRQRLSKTVLEDLTLPFPPLDEQQNIVALLSKIQCAIKIQERIILICGQLKNAALRKLFHEGLRGESLKQTEIGEIPESWDLRRIDSVCRTVSGGTPSKERLDWWKGTLPWASPKDMKRLRLSDAEDHITLEAAERGSRVVPPGTIFIVIRGMILAKDIPVAIADVPMAFNQDMKALVPTGVIDPDYLLYALSFSKAALTLEIGRSAHGTRRIGTSSIDDLLIPFPSDSGEQREIAAVLNAIDNREQIAKRKIVVWGNVFDSALHSLLDGSIRTNRLDLAEVANA